MGLALVIVNKREHILNSPLIVERKLQNSETFESILALIFEMAYIYNNHFHAKGGCHCEQQSTL